MSDLKLNRGTNSAAGSERYITPMDKGEPEREPGETPLRRGWTTGACATAATRGAIEALWTGKFPDPVTIKLPNGQPVSFSLATQDIGAGWASSGVVKDARDDPDVTHGAMVIAAVRENPAGSGVTFHAGKGVGAVTRPGLAIPPGEPAINPVPREMIRTAISEAAQLFGKSCDIAVEISIPGGEALALKTLNGRLGIVGGLSILGTTGIVIPFSCAAWIHSIHRGIDVARATGLTHIAGSTGTTSEASVARLYELPDTALIEMGDFAGGMLKYLKSNPVPRVTIAGGFAKLSKLAQGHLDLHSGRSSIDMDALGKWLADLGSPQSLVAEAQKANTAQQVLELAEMAGIPLADLVARRGRETAKRVLAATGIGVDVVIFDRQGKLAGRSDIELA